MNEFSGLNNWRDDGAVYKSEKIRWKILWVNFCSAFENSMRYQGEIRIQVSETQGEMYIEDSSLAAV